MKEALWAAISEQIRAASGISFVPQRQQATGGGCINATHVLDDGQQRWFVKINTADRQEMFAAEADGLRELAASQTIRVPRPLCHGIAEGQAFLVLEWLDLRGSESGGQLARQLAAMHGVVQEQFGWWRDNTIGATLQVNTREHAWPEFFARHRLGFQLELARQAGNGRLLAAGEKLLQNLGGFFVGHTPVPSLLHGDLWGGNHAVTAIGEPVVFDPAVYYGDREADLAMSELFGGFSARFYAVYNEIWPLDAGYRVRKNLYNLYHILNHYHLFGGGYGGQALRMTESLLGELG